MSEKKSDFGTAALGFFGGAIVIGLWLFGVSKFTTSKYEGEHAEKAAPSAEHK
jgi:hypothetical protein